VVRTPPDDLGQRLRSGGAGARGLHEYTVVPRRQVLPFRSTLPWHILGAVPETLRSVYGSLTIGLDLQRGQSLLIRGGTASVRLAAATIAKDLGATVVSTTGQPDRADALKAHGVDAALEWVGTPTLLDTLASTRIHGTVCFTGMLSNQWTVPNFYPIAHLPRGVRLKAYSGGSGDLTVEVIQDGRDDLAVGAVQ
jgi:NADPH:quinone reductase